MSFARKFGDSYGKRLMDATSKTGIDASKAAPKRVVRKIAEGTGDFIGNKIADMVTSACKSKQKRKKVEEIYIPTAKRQQIIDDIKKF